MERAKVSAGRVSPISDTGTVADPVVLGDLRQLGGHHQAAGGHHHEGGVHHPELRRRRHLERGEFDLGLTLLTSFPASTVFQSPGSLSPSGGEWRTSAADDDDGALDDSPLDECGLISGRWCG